MLLVGLMICALFQAFGHYYVEGVGYATIQDVLLGGLAAGPLLGLLFTWKLTATSLTLGSGSSGGIFSPFLFMPRGGPPSRSITPPLPDSRPLQPSTMN
jgi:CIC family chloride channel protein